MNNLPYRPNVCLFIINRNLEIFIGLRSNSTDIWQLPQGGAEEDLDLAGNALREASEELGVAESSFEIIKQLEASHRYDFRVPPEFARGVYRGQDQTFWLLRFTGEDSEIDLNRHTPEFKEWCWIHCQHLIDKVEPIRRAGYQKALPEVIAYIQAEQD